MGARYENVARAIGASPGSSVSFETRNPIGWLFCAIGLFLADRPWRSFRPNYATEQTWTHWATS
jgi:hypothetical protein